MQDLTAERGFHEDLFGQNPANEHITQGYEIHELALANAADGAVLDFGGVTGRETTTRLLW